MARALVHLTAKGAVAAPAMESPATPSSIVPLAPDRDRREFPRHPSRCIALIHRLEGHLPPGPQLEWAFHRARWSGEVIDISMSGAALVVDTPPAVSDTLRLRFQNRLMGTTADASATVLRCEPADEGGTKVMCEFVRQMPLDQVRALGWEPFESSLI
ncbi:MAG: PilZ domain-containing protein [Planctomycetaceae bacterium]|nr:PilZ domain-containing protein [Planctomycetaceae bacterium]